jgi:predicted transcriptional regulator
MNTSIHIPDDLVQRLQKFLKEKPQKTSKNSIIIQAIEQFLDEQENSWGQEFLEWEKREELESLELDRKDFWGEEFQIS